MDPKKFLTTEGIAVVLAIVWVVAAQQGWFPPSLDVDLPGLGPTQMSPAWLIGYALVRTAKKTATDGDIPFTASK